MFEDRKKLYFVNELMFGGSLFERINKLKNFNE